MGVSAPGQNSLKFLALMIQVCSENLHPDCLGNRDWQRIFGHKQRELSITKFTQLVLVGYRDLAITFREHVLGERVEKAVAPAKCCRVVGLAAIARLAGGAAPSLDVLGVAMRAAEAGKPLGAELRHQIARRPGAADRRGRHHHRRAACIARDAPALRSIGGRHSSSIARQFRQNPKALGGVKQCQATKSVRKCSMSIRLYSLLRAGRIADLYMIRY